MHTQSSYHNFSDFELFALTKKENTEAFGVLYQRHWPELIDTAYRRLQSKQRAEDLVQEIFISLYNKRASLQFTVSLKAYLHQALKFKILNEFRSDFVRTTYSKSVFFNQNCKNDFAENIESKELQYKICNLLDQLPDKCKQVFTLSRNEHMSNKEIAMALNISLSTVEKHISKALKILRDSLKSYSYSC